MEREIKRQLELDLGDEIKVVVVIERGGQEPPQCGDEIFVVGSIILPTVQQENYSFIIPSLVFGQRLLLMGEALHTTWGDRTPQGRKREETFRSTTFSAAFSAAEKALEGEVDKLRLSLAARRGALAAAEGLPLPSAARGNKAKKQPLAGRKRRKK